MAPLRWLTGCVCGVRTCVCRCCARERARMNSTHVYIPLRLGSKGHARCRDSWQVSNDLDNTLFANVELYMMGLMSAADFQASGDELAYCPIPNGQVPIDEGNSRYRQTCNGDLQVIPTRNTAAHTTPTARQRETVKHTTRRMLTCESLLKRT